MSTNKFKRMYIYKNSHLPKEGWLQGCFMCYKITGGCEVFSKYYNYENTLLYEFVVYLCNSCKNKILKEREIKQEYYKYVNDYIKKSGIVSTTTKLPLPSLGSSESSSSLISLSSSSLPNKCPTPPPNISPI